MLKRILFLSRTRYFPRKLQRNHVLSAAADNTYGTIIDVGGGQSKYKNILKCSKYISTDIEDRVGDGSVVIADANVSLPFDDSTADLVLCTEVLEHLHTPAKALSEMYRVLKPGGKLVITVPFLWPEHEAPVDFYRYTQWGITHMVTQAGFIKCEAKNTNGFWVSILSLLVSKMKSKFFAPLVLLFNILIIFIHKVERQKTMPLGVHLIAFKP